MKRILIADSDHDELVIAQSVLGTMDNLEVVGDTTSYSLLPSLIERQQPDYVMIAMRYRANDAVDAVKAVRDVNGSCQIIVLSSQPDAEDILQCLRAGANEFIGTPLDTNELQSVIERLNQKPAVQSIATEAESTGKVTAVCGCRGGCGTTTLAVNLAEHLSHHAQTALVDFHFGQGDLAVYLNITPSITLADIQQTSERLDDALIESATYKHSDRFHLLLQSPDNANQVWNTKDTVQLIQHLRRKYDYVIIDCGTDVDCLKELHEQVQHCVLAMKQDMASLSLAQVKLDSFKQMGMGDDRVSVAVNAFTKKTVITPARIAKVLQRTDFSLIREEEKVVQTALNRGVPLREVSRWSRSARDIKKMAEQLTGEKITTQQQSETKETEETEAVPLRPLAVYQQSAEPAI